MDILSIIPFNEPWIFLLIGFLIALSAFMQGVGGVGFTMLVAPVALMISPELVPGPLLTLGFLMAFMSVLRELSDVNWGLALVGIAGRGVGAVVAVIALASLSGTLLDIVFASLILIAVLLSMSGLNIQPTRPNIGVAGIVSGVMGTITSVGSPPLAITFQHGAPAVVRATLATIFTSGTALSIIALIASGHYELQEAVLGTTLIPFLLLGFWLSNRARHYVSAPLLRRWLLIFCALTALLLVGKTLLTL